MVSQKITVIVVMGQKGAGKSTFIKYATRSAEIETGGEGTQELQDWRVPGTELLLIDTPGFDDTGLNDNSILDQIRNYQENNATISGVIWIHDITQRSMKRKSTEIEKMLVFGIGCSLDSCCLVTTKWPLLPQAQAFLNQSRLRNDPQLLGPLCQQGASIKGFDQTCESALEILNCLRDETYKPHFTSELVPSIESQPQRNSELENALYAQIAELQRDAERRKWQEESRNAEESARKQRSRNRRLRWLARAGSLGLAAIATESDKKIYRGLGIGAYVATEMACQGQKLDEERELKGLGQCNRLDIIGGKGGISKDTY